RHATLVGNLCQTGNVDHVAGRVADRLAEHRLGLAINCSSNAVEIVVADETHFNTATRQAVGEEVVGAAVQLADGDDVVAHFGDGLQRILDCRHAGGYCQRTDTALHRRHALLEHGVGRVHDAGVDIAGHLQVEQVGTVLGAVER